MLSLDTTDRDVKQQSNPPKHTPSIKKLSKNKSKRNLNKRKAKLRQDHGVYEMGSPNECTKPSEYAVSAVIQSKGNTASKMFSCDDSSIKLSWNNTKDKCGEYYPLSQPVKIIPKFSKKRKIENTNNEKNKECNMSCENVKDVTCIEELKSGSNKCLHSLRTKTGNISHSTCLFTENSYDRNTFVDENMKTISFKEPKNSLYSTKKMGTQETDNEIKHSPVKNTCQGISEYLSDSTGIEKIKTDNTESSVCQSLNQKGNLTSEQFSHYKNNAQEMGITHKRHIPCTQSLESESEARSIDNCGEESTHKTKVTKGEISSLGTKEITEVGHKGLAAVLNTKNEALNAEPNESDFIKMFELGNSINNTETDSDTSNVTESIKEWIKSDNCAKKIDKTYCEPSTTFSVTNCTKLEESITTATQKFASSNEDETSKATDPLLPSSHCQNTVIKVGSCSIDPSVNKEKKGISVPSPTEASEFLDLESLEITSQFNQMEQETKQALVNNNKEFILPPVASYPIQGQQNEPVGRSITVHHGESLALNIISELNALSQTVNRIQKEMENIKKGMPLSQSFCNRGKVRLNW
ncbi:uncharacterized protein LOC143248863 isoform X3 [Tachypleus tridentatus]